jgi:hypothetical protein
MGLDEWDYRNRCVVGIDCARCDRRDYRLGKSAARLSCAPAVLFRSRRKTRRLDARRLIEFTRARIIFGARARRLRMRESLAAKLRRNKKSNATAVARCAKFMRHQSSEATIFSRSLIARWIRHSADNAIYIIRDFSNIPIRSRVTCSDYTLESKPTVYRFVMLSDCIPVLHPLMCRVKQISFKIFNARMGSVPITFAALQLNADVIVYTESKSAST